MISPNHSPLPWTTGQDWTFRDAHDQTVADFLMPGLERETVEANMELTHHRFRTFPYLVSALEEIVGIKSTGVLSSIEMRKVAVGALKKTDENQ